MCGPHASLCSSAASHPTYGPSHPDPAGGSFKQNRISSVSEQLFSFSLLYLIRTTRKTGGLLTGYKPVVLGQRLKALAFTTFKPHSH